MTYIEDLLKEHCPNGVEWKTLGEVVDYEQPTKYIVKSKEYSDDYSVPVLTAGQTFILGYTNEETGIYPASKEHSVIIFDDFTTARKWVDFEFKVKSSAMKILSIKSECQDEVSIRYVWHYLGTIKYAPEQHARQWIGIFSKFKIPLPPLEIQQEIVKILDKFTEYVTELTAELTAELTLRQKQYSYYRDRLLSFEDQVYQVEWKTLGEVFDIVAGGDVPKDNFSERQTDRYLIPILSNGIEEKSLYGWTNIPKVDKPSLTVSARGTIGWTSYREKPFYPIVRLLVLTPKIELNLRYAYHFMKSIEDKYDVPQSGIPQLTKPMIKDKSIPLPSLATQARIVQVLDNFDTVCNDLSIGLPKEIELRQKQYEFFRDKLLTFAAEGVYTDSTVQYRQDLIRLLTWVFGPIRVELGAVCDLVRGNGLQKKDFVDSGVPCIHYGQIYTYYGLATDETKSFVSPELAQKLKKASYGNVIVATTSENSEDVGKSLVWLGQTEACIGGHSCLLKSEQLGKYLVYYMQTTDFQRQKEKMLVGTKVIELYPKNLARIQFILPPLDQQKHIASILDRFDTLTTDLSQGLPAEIEQRQKQYEYWRDQLLQF